MRNRRSSKLRHALEMIQQLESRRLLSTLNWTNKGSGAGALDTDNFNAVYGATNGPLARLIVQRAMDDWERVITDFNFAGGGNTFTLNISATVFSGGLRGQTGSIGRDSSVSRKPNSATIQLDDNGGGAGWYFDPQVGTATVPDDGEFTSLLTPFDADANAITGYDIYRTAAHEMGHAMGLLLNTNGFLKISDVTTSLGITDPRDSGESLYGVNVNGGASDYTLTSSGGGHLFEGGGTFSGPTHPNDIMNAGRNVPTGTRRLISDDTASLLRDVYGYTVTLPRSINTFYANLNRTSNTLVINGDLNENGNDNDTIIVDVVGTDTRVRVGGTTELIPNSEYSTIIVQGGEGNDILYIDALPSGKTVTVNGQNGNDLVVFSDLVADLDSGILSDVTINGGAGSDSVRMDDINDGVGSDSYTVTGASFTKNTFFATLNADVELMTVNGSPQASTYNINSSTFNLVINGGGANDTINVGSGDVDTNIVGLITINGGGGTDRVVFNDTTDGVGSDTLTFAVGSLNKGGQVVTYNTIEAIVWNASAQNTVFTVNAHGSGIPVTINGGAGNESFVLGNGDLDNNIGSPMTLNGGGGTDSINFSDSLDGAGSNTYTLTASTLVKPLISFGYSGFESFTISGSNTPAAYNINGSSSANTVVNGGSGNDTFTVGGGDVDTNLGTNITVNGGLGTDDLILDDSTDGSGADTATFTAGQIVKGGQTFIYSSMATLVWTGAALATTYNVNGTTLGTPVTINGGAGNDTFNVGGGDFDSNINGDVRTSGGGGTDRLNINDASDDGSVLDTYTLTGSSFSKSSSGTANISYGSTFLGGAPLIDQIVLNASNFDSIINVTSTGSTSFAIPPATPTNFPVPTTINGSGGADVITLAAGNIGTIRGNISVSGGAGVDQLIVNNSSTSADGETTTITHNSLTNTAWDYALSFDTSSDSFTYNAGSGADVINYNATAAAPATVILNGNNGIDTFNIIEGTATVHGGAGLDNVVANQTEAGTAGVVFDGSEDLGNLYSYVASTFTVVPNGNIKIDANSLGFLRGTLNLNDNTLISRTTGASFLTPRLAQGYNGGAWNGLPGVSPLGAITSGRANTTTRSDGIGYATIGGGVGQLNRAVFQGVAVAVGNVVLTYTLNGDTDLDRDVDFDDLLAVSQNYNLTGRNWFQGNSNYDATGATNFDDLLSLAQNYGLPFLQEDAVMATGSNAATALVRSVTPTRTRAKNVIV